MSISFPACVFFSTACLNAGICFMLFLFDFSANLCTRSQRSPPQFSDLCRHGSSGVPLDVSFCESKICISLQLVGVFIETLTWRLKLTIYTGFTSFSIIAPLHLTQTKVNYALSRHSVIHTQHYCTVVSECRFILDHHAGYRVCLNELFVHNMLLGIEVLQKPTQLWVRSSLVEL